MMDVDGMQGAERVDSRDIISVAAKLRDETPAWDVGDPEYALLAFDAEEGPGIAEYTDGTWLIREDTFTNYARDIAEGMGAIDPDADWPLSYIDWDAAADALRLDYTDVRFLGYDYLVRA